MISCLKKLNGAREINIINNKLFYELVKQLGISEIKNLYLKASLWSNNKISIFWKSVSVQFVNGNDGAWFKIIELREEIIYLKKLLLVT